MKTCPESGVAPSLVHHRWAFLLAVAAGLLALPAHGQELDERTRARIAMFKERRATEMSGINEIYLRELRKLEEKYRGSGDLSALEQVRAKLVEAGLGPSPETLAGVLLDAKPAAPIRKLKVGVGRYAGAWEGADITRVAEELEGADFLPPARAEEAEITGTCETEGYLYLVGGDLVVQVDGKPRAAEKVYRKIEASGLEGNAVVRMLLFAGERFQLAGKEPAIVAAEIGFP